MSDNPYESPNEGQDIPEAPVELPTYWGTLSHVRGTIDKESTLAMISECKDIDDWDVPVSPSQSQPRVWRSLVLPLLVVTVVAIFFFLDDGKNTASGAPEPLEENPLWLSVAMGISAAYAVGSVAIFVYLMIRYRAKVEKEDPPPWGESEIRFGEDWLSVARRSVEGVMVTVYARWKDTHVRRSGRAWCLYCANVCTALIPHEWISGQGDRQVFEGFLHQLSVWRQMLLSDPQAIKELAKEHESMRDRWWPEKPDDTSVTFLITDEIPRRDVSKLLSRIEGRFPNWKHKRVTGLTPWLWRYSGGLAILFILASIGSCIWQGYALSGLSIFVPCLIVAILSFLFGRTLGKVASYQGWVTTDAIWVHQGAVKVKFGLEGFSQRLVIDDSDVLIVANDSGKSLCWMPRIAFENNEAWERAVETVGAR